MDNFSASKNYKSVFKAREGSIFLWQWREQAQYL